MNINLDVLELIFGKLDGPDLVAAALVSRAFLAGAIPSLYAHIEYTVHHAKRAHQVMSPFATLVAHDHLVVHVKHIAVHAAPSFRHSPSQPSPSFLNNLAHVLRTATNLRSFVCTVNILPPLLPHLVDRHRLHHLRIYAGLGRRQMAVLQDCTALHSLSLDSPSSDVIDAVPAWTAGMHKTLTHLTLFMSQHIDANILNTILAQLPRLRGLHLISCLRITHIAVLKALSHTPNLRELSFTIFPSQDNALPPLNFSIPPLTHLSIDVRASYPGLKSLIADIISRLSPRDALAICGGWIGEIKSSSERANAPQDAGDGAGPGTAGVEGGDGPLGPNFHVWQGHVHVHGPLPGHGHAHGHGHDQVNDLPLLTPTHAHHGNTQPNQNGGAHTDNPALPPPLNLFGFPIPFPPGDPNGNNIDNNNDIPAAGPANPHIPNLNPDSNSPSLVSVVPSTLAILHLPQLSPAALAEVVERCEGIQVLGIIIGNTFASPASVKASRMTDRIREYAVKSGIRPEANLLAGILSHARALRELIIDTSGMDISGRSTGASTDARAGGSHGTPSKGGALLTRPAVRMLMQESSCLRRIVGEGRVWECCAPTPSSPVPSPHRLDIEPTPSKARYGPGAGNIHAHGPPGFGTHGGGYGQVETENDHWFWLTDSASAGKFHRGF